MMGGSIELLRSLERFSVAALPARNSWELPGWLCLADDGAHVGRANSATPMPSEQSDEAPATLSEVAASYRERSLPPLIRWTPEAPSTLASQLAENGWDSAGEVFVMVRPIPTRPNAGNEDNAGAPLAPTEFEVELTAEASPAWRETFGSSFSEEEAAARLRLALAAPQEKRFAEVRLDGVTAGVGLGISRDGKIGLFDIFVEQQFRRRGIAKRLITALESWAAETGADQAFLQVAANNDAAVALYRRLDFEVAYTYVYAGPELDSDEDDSAD